MQQNIPSRSLDSVYGFSGTVEVNFGKFLSAVASCAAQLPEHAFVVNLCANRLTFATVFFASLLRGQTNILLPGSSASLQKSAREHFSDSYVVDNAAAARLAGSGSDDSDPAAIYGQIRNLPLEHVAAIVFSSGTTGLQKQIRKTWGSLFLGAQVNANCLTSHLTLPAAIIPTVPHWHMYGLEWTVLLPFVVDLAVCTPSALFPDDIREHLARAQGRRALLSTPLHLRALLDSGLELPAFDLFISATAPLSTANATHMESRWGAASLEIYGCSELGSMASRSPTKNEPWRFFPEFDVVSDGADVTLQAAHTGAPVQLSDQLEFVANGRFIIRGRDQDMVKVAGKRGSLADINACVLSIDEVIDCVVFDPAVLKLQETGRLGAVVLTRSLSPAEIRRRLLDLIDPAFMPRPIYIVDHIPRTETGKLSQTDLHDLVVAAKQAVQRGN